MMKTTTDESNTEDNILRSLRKQSMTIEEVSRQLKISRATASKYLLVLETKNRVKHREIGKAKLFFLR
jgi:response regulator of citrate/malate metabolism